MQADGVRLQLFVVRDELHAFVNVVLEHLFVVLLLLKRLFLLAHLVLQTFLPHSQIIYDESKVLVDAVEVLQFLFHFACLLLKLLDFNLSRADVAF